MLEIIRSLLIGMFAIAVLLPVVRFAMRRLLSGSTGEKLTLEEQQYIQKKEWRLTFAYFFFACVLAVFSAGALAMLSSIIHASTGGWIHLLTPNFRAFFAPGLLLGLTLAVLPLRMVQRSLLGHDYEMYQSHLLQTEGRGSIKIYRLLFLTMVIISGVVVWFVMQWHIRIFENTLTVTNMLSEERSYSMSQISKIEYLGAEGEYLITFNDNSNINTTYLKPVQLEMIALLSEKSGKKVIR
ncbi:hypothetical protein JAO76_05595 [Pontibacter sp. BT310]|uniref:DUF5671 domain-containing protein n=1 Tax=Pontibacter populi TaxID=890055 RepID=A0ABS6X952_9BACT|nr:MULTISPECIES: hypothetical protein [Pontibacter]MBJ6117652.1 hypothetical protein [Pontibacter sp. BT310]MBR0570078.1 hypothetical protein [Microvirga sp. STS03]MBW3364504.1 hypothetical protein [Pontibacter populi]